MKIYIYIYLYIYTFDFTTCFYYLSLYVEWKQGNEFLLLVNTFYNFYICSVCVSVNKSNLRKSFYFINILIESYSISNRSRDSNTLFVHLSGFPFWERNCPNPGKLGASESAGFYSVRLSISCSNLLWFFRNSGELRKPSCGMHR